MYKTILLCLLPMALWAQSAATEIFDANAQAGVLAQALKAYYGIEGDLRLTPAGEASDLSAVPDKVEILEAPERVSSMMLLRARFSKGEDAIATISAPFKAELRVDAFIAKRQLARRSNPSADDFSIQSVDALSVRNEVIPANTDFSQYEVSSTIPAGSVLTWAQLKPKPLVHKGSLVDVIVDHGTLKITSRAVAMADAGLNETVVLRNLTTNRQFQAKVVNENLAQIYL